MKSQFKIQNVFKGDIAIWIIYLVLSIVSLTSVFSSIGLYAIDDYGSTPLHLFLKHGLFVIAAYVLIIMITPVKTNTLYKMANIVFAASLILVVYALVLRTRWIELFGIRFQPSEVVKLGLVMFLARIMHQHQDELDDNKFFIILVIVVGAASALIMPENLSTAILIFTACMFAMFFGGIQLKNWMKVMAVMALVGVLALFVFYKFGDQIAFFRSSTWGSRIEHWLHPSTDLTQENMAKMAIATGGFGGKGIGETIQARLMTQAHNDFIFAIIIEEMGAWFGVFIFALYTVFFRRCIKIVTRCKETFNAVLVAGIGSIIYLQAIINMSVAVGLLPVTGQTLPFVSYGGTAYLILSGGIGMIQCVAYNTKKQESKDETEKHNS